MLTIEFEDRVHRKFLHTGEADLALVQVALNRLAATSGKPAESLRFPSEPNVYLIPTPSDLRIVVRYEPQKIVVEDILSQRVLDRFREPIAS